MTSSSRRASFSGFGKKKSDARRQSNSDIANRLGNTNVNRRQRDNKQQSLTTDDIENTTITDPQLRSLQPNPGNSGARQNRVRNSTRNSQRQPTTRNTGDLIRAEKIRNQKAIARRIRQQILLTNPQREGTLNWERFLPRLDGTNQNDSYYQNPDARARILQDIAYIYAQRQEALGGLVVDSGNYDFNRSFQDIQKLSDQKLQELLQDQNEPLLEYLRQEYITWANSDPTKSLESGQGIDIAIGKSIRDVQPDLDAFEARRQAALDAGEQQLAENIANKIAQVKQRQQTAKNDILRLRNFRDQRLNDIQRDMFENRIKLLVSAGDMEAVNNIAFDIMRLGNELDRATQQTMFGQPAFGYAQNLLAAARNQRNQLIQQATYIKTAGAMPDKSSEYRFLYRNIDKENATSQDKADAMEEIIVKKLGQQGQDRMRFLREQFNDDIAQIAARDLALMSNTDAIFDEFVDWVTGYEVTLGQDTSPTPGSQLTDENTIMSMMNRWYESQETVTLYRALAVTDDVANIIMSNGMQSQAAFSAPTDTNGIIPNYGVMIQEQPLVVDVKRKTKKDKYIAQQKARPYPRKRILLPLGTTEAEDSGNDSTILGSKAATQGKAYIDSVFSAQTKSDVDVDLTQSVTFHPEVAKTVASDPDFTGSSIPNVVMFRLNVPKSAVIKPEVIDPPQSNEEPLGKYDLVPLNAYIPKGTNPNSEVEQTRKVNLSQQEPSQTESWIYGNIPASWIDGYENVTNDPFEIDESIFR